MMLNLLRIYWCNLCGEFEPLSWLKLSSNLLSCIGLLYKLYRELAVSKTMFFVPPPRALIARPESWKALNFGKIGHQYLVSKTMPRI